MKIVYDELFSKLRLNLYEKVLDHLVEACALGVECVKIVGKCGNFTIHAFLHVALQDLECITKTIGIAVEVSKSHVLNTALLQLLKYSNTIVEGDDTALLYIDPKFTLGVFYLTCRDSEITWIEHSEYDPGEADYFNVGE